MGIDWAARDSDEFYIHTCVIKDKSSGGTAPTGGAVPTYTARDSVQICLKEVIDQGDTTAMQFKPAQVAVVHFRLYLPSDVSIDLTNRVSELTGEDGEFDVVFIPEKVTHDSTTGNFFNLLGIENHQEVVIAQSLK